MSDERDCFAAWQAGHSAIVARELAGRAVPPAWLARLAELEAACVAAEDARRAAVAVRPALFGARGEGGR